MNIEDSNDQSGTLRVASNAARRLDILGTRFWLTEYNHQPQSNDVETNGDHVGGNGNVHAALIREQERQPSFRCRNFSRTDAACKFHRLVTDLPVVKQTFSLADALSSRVPS